jgi:hypothetical protein
MFALRSSKTLLVVVIVFSSFFSRNSFGSSAWTTEFGLPDVYETLPLQSLDLSFLRPFVSTESFSHHPWFYEDGDYGDRVVLMQPSWADTERGMDLAGIFVVTIYNGNPKRVDLIYDGRDSDEFSSKAYWGASYEGPSLNELVKTSEEFYTPHPESFDSSMLQFPGQLGLSELFQDTTPFEELWGISVPPAPPIIAEVGVWVEQAKELNIGLRFVDGQWVVIE